MPALTPTEIHGTVTFIGITPDRDATLRSDRHDQVELTFAGLPGEDHGGETRASCSRVVAQYPRGTLIRNVRQLSVVSEEELATIARTMGIDRLDPADIGASLVLSGIPDFSHLPPSARLQSEAGTTLVVDMQNRPCHLPSPYIDEGDPGAGRGFKAAAKGLRGVTAWVERPGPLMVGDRMRVHVPDQRAWQGLD